LPRPSCQAQQPPRLTYSPVTSLTIPSTRLGYARGCIVPDLISLRAGDAEATVAPAVGANCLAFRVGGRDLLEGPPALEARAAPPAPLRGPWRWDELPSDSSTLLTDLPEGEVEARAGDALLRWPGDRFGEVVLYRPPGRASVCVEPWSSVSSAAARAEPGQR